MKDRETAQEKLEYEIFSEQCFEQEKERRKKKEKRIQCDGIDCAWCGIIECPREKSNDR